MMTILRRTKETAGNGCANFSIALTSSQLFVSPDSSAFNPQRFSTAALSGQVVSSRKNFMSPLSFGQGNPPSFPMPRFLSIATTIEKPAEEPERSVPTEPSPVSLPAFVFMVYCPL